MFFIAGHETTFGSQAEDSKSANCCQTRHEYGLETESNRRVRITPRVSRRFCSTEESRCTCLSIKYACEFESRLRRCLGEWRERE